jgi:glycosyltransferase involved in cell wall biosynthesis
MKVSVITPVYNGAKYLGPAIESVLAQTMQDWELVVVDDGSTDETPQVIQRYTHPRIVRLRQPNSGEAGARHTGLLHARGEYIGWLDADDLYLPCALAGLSGFLEEHPDCDVVYSDGHICDAQGKLLTLLSDHRADCCTGNILERIVLTSLITAPVCALTRRSPIERYGIQFDSRLVIGGDWDFWTQLARHVRFGYLDELTCMYRVHGNNITRVTGRGRRNSDLVSGRMKVLDADWFSDLSLATRGEFFYMLVVDLLANQSERQRDIMRGQKFRQLPAQRQAALWRQVGIQYVIRGTEPAFAAECLRIAQQLGARDWKNGFLLYALRSGTARRMAPHALRFWQVMHNALERARNPGKRWPKPVPTGLAPQGE